MKQFAKRNSIEDPMIISVSVLSEIYKVEEKKTDTACACRLGVDEDGIP